MQLLQPRLMGKYFTGCSLQYDLTCFHHHDPICLCNFRHVVRHGYDRHSFFMQLAYDSQNFLAPVAVKHARCLIQYDTLRSHCQYSRDGNPLFLSARQMMWRAMAKFAHPNSS
ncbi:Uncharacterised protein [Mycobacterium tuberculosis]|nr:Uncharacterised protein [Mycobacterium tuberculosis]